MYVDQELVEYDYMASDRQTDRQTDRKNRKEYQETNET